MKYILIQSDQNELGPFNSVTQNADGWIADDSIYYTSVFGIMTSSEVSDDYMTPSQILTYNDNQSQLRLEAYPVDSDPIFFQYQRGIKTQQEWLDAVAAVQAKYPYKEQV
jgi:hypothetical protein